MKIANITTLAVLASLIAVPAFASGTTAGAPVTKSPSAIAKKKVLSVKPMKKLAHRKIAKKASK